MDEILPCYHSNETSSAVLSHVTICFVFAILSFESLDEILWCYHSNESSLAEHFLVIFISWDLYENRFENFVIFRPLSGRNSRVERLRRSQQ